MSWPSHLHVSSIFHPALVWPRLLYHCPLCLPTNTLLFPKINHLGCKFFAYIYFFSLFHPCSLIRNNNPQGGEIIELQSDQLQIVNFRISVFQSSISSPSSSFSAPHVSTFFKFYFHHNFFVSDPPAALRHSNLKFILSLISALSFLSSLSVSLGGSLENAPSRSWKTSVASLHQLSVWYNMKGNVK